MITSRQNARIKNYIKLSTLSKERRKQNAFTLEGARLCFDAVKSGIVILECFYTEKALLEYDGFITPLLNSAKESFLLDPTLLNAVSQTKTPQGIFIVCEKRSDTSFTPNENGKYIALENIQSPRNLGAIARTAETLGLDGMIVSGGCDLYVPQAQRSAMGSLLRLPILEVSNMAQAVLEYNADGLVTIATVVENDAVFANDYPFTDGSVLVIGNEGDGITTETATACLARVTIPMKGSAQSLNAANAAAILMWEMVQGGKA